MSESRFDPALERLLGPREPELGCDDCFELLDEYVELERELGPADADARVPGMRAHLAGCPACHGEHDSLHALLASDER
jgi:hypothetical protein